MASSCSDEEEISSNIFGAGDTDIVVADNVASTCEDCSSPSVPYSLSSTISREHCIFISSLILISHALFIWGQADTLWALYAFTEIDAEANATSDISEAVMNYRFNDTSRSIGSDNEQSYLLGSWSYGEMIAELWGYTKITSFFLFVFSALWPHLKLVLLHVYLYFPCPSKPRRAAIYWLDTVGKMSLTDVCVTCMLFLLLNIQADIDVNAFANKATILMEEIVSTNGTILALSNKTQTILDKAGTWAYEEVTELADSIFINDDPKIYSSFLEAGCSTFYNNGETCEGTTFYEPSTARGGIAGIMTKCLRIRKDKCYQCECIVNSAIYNHAIPSEVVQTAINNVMSLLFAELLSVIKSGDTEFASWFSVDGDATVGSYITIYPAFLGFMFAVIISIMASLSVAHVEEKDSMKRILNASSLIEALSNGGYDNDQRSQLFAAEGQTKRKFVRVLSIIFGIGIIPLIVFAVYVDMFKFSIAGLLEELVLMQVVATEKLYSIIDCVTTVNDGSGYGKTFAVVYAILMLATPLLRAALLALVSIVPMTPIWHVRLASISNSVGSFIAWEPFFFCAFLIMTQMPTVSENAVNPETCEAIQNSDLMHHLISTFGLDGSTCFVIRFDMLPAITLFVVSWSLLTGFNSLAWKVVLERYDPHGSHERDGDIGGPYCNCQQCCYFSCCPKRQSEVDLKASKTEDVASERE